MKLNSLPRPAWGFATILLIALIAPSISQSRVVRTVPVPAVAGPIPVTATSRPFAASDRNFEPVDLGRLGYVEEEFLINGAANVYDWMPDGSIAVRTPDVPYRTRLLVRRPSSPDRFSGNVIVELMYTARRFDWPMIWGYSRDFFLENGDAWIGITMPNAAAGLKKFDPARYAGVSFANPSSVPCATGATLSETEDGLRWDAISQVAALLKSDRPGRPLASLRVEAVFLTTQGADVVTYINAIHPNSALPGGKPVFDGYLIKSPTAPARIHQCASVPGEGDPRRAIATSDVPVFSIVAQGEVLDAVPFRKPDSDAPDNKYRLYEIAGAGHIDKSAYAGFPPLTDQIAAVGSAQGSLEWPFNAPCDPAIPMMAVPVMSHAMNAAFFNLEEWTRKGITPPRASRIQIRNTQASDPAVALDANGHATGGVRNPYVDVPASTLFTNSTGPGVCREMGRESRFDQERFRAAYGTDQAYVKEIADSADRLLRERWLTAGDASRIKQEAAARVSK